MSKKKRVLLGIPFVVSLILWVINYYFASTLSYAISASIWTITSIVIIFLNIDSKYLLYIFVLIPFTYARRFEIGNIPVHLLIGIIIVLLSMVLKFIIDKRKIYFNRLMLSVSIFCLALLLGGIFTPNFKIINVLIILLLDISIMFIIIYFSSSKMELTFYEFSEFFIYLGIIICLQVGIRMLDTRALLEKESHLGWADNSNNIALILSFTIPIIFYRLLKKNILYNIFLSIVSIVIVISSSRGILLLVTFFIVGFILYISIKKLWNKQLVISFIIQLIVLSSIFIFEFINNYELINKILILHFDSFNGRKGIYYDAMELYNKYPLFGSGFFVDNERETFLFAHSTLIQTLSSLGVFGLFALIFYYLTIYNIDLKLAENKVLFFSLLIPEIYGMVDVSIYYIVYLLILLFVIVFISKNPSVLRKKSIKNESIS